MLKRYADEIIKEYLKPIFGFSLNKTGRIDEAEELTSRIVLKTYQTLLFKDDIRDAKSYIWKLAHNVWADYVKELKIQSKTLELDDVFIPLGGLDLFAEIANSEDIHALRMEIAYLSKVQRQVVTMYYFDDLKLTNIADKLKLPLGTVKWHIFEAKKELRKGMDIMRKVGELGLRPIEFSSMGHYGYCGPKGDTSYYLARKITQNIAYAAYHKPASINEIADELGISPVFVTDEVNTLEEYGFMDKVDGDRYITNIYVIEFDNENVELQHKLYSEYAEKVVHLYCEQFFDMQKEFDETGIYYPDKDYNFLLWSVIPYAIKEKFYRPECELVKYEELAVARKDGGNYIAHVCLDRTSNLSFDRDLYRVCGDMERGIDTFPIWAWQFNTYWSDRERTFVNFTNEDLNKVGKFVNGHLPYNEGFIDEYRFLIERGYLVKENNQFKMNLVWLPSSEATSKFRAALPDVSDELKMLAADLDKKIGKMIMQYMPKHLEKLAQFHSQNVMLDGNFRAHILKHLVDSGKLVVPQGAKKKTLTTIMGIR